MAGDEVGVRVVRDTAAVDETARGEAVGSKDEMVGGERGSRGKW
jgi:hypothetical protein